MLTLQHQFARYSMCSSYWTGTSAYRPNDASARTLFKRRSASTCYLKTHLETEHVTIAERMRAGYTNAFLGKWHIAPSVSSGGRVAEEFSPIGQGLMLISVVPVTVDLQLFALQEC